VLPHVVAQRMNCHRSRVRLGSEERSLPKPSVAGRMHVNVHFAAWYGGRKRRVSAYCVNTRRPARDDRGGPGTKLAPAAASALRSEDVDHRDAYCLGCMFAC
jgi:hypothetical protein